MNKKGGITEKDEANKKKKAKKKKQSIAACGKKDKAADLSAPAGYQ